jgi:2-polyprenyl-3-methyl-5-hydroxy-6-metoxy-1,4-benzoquinol methylase
MYAIYLATLMEGDNNLENDIKIFYDLTAERTADEWYKEEILMPTILDFVSLLPDHPRILDLGCGPGHESMRLASTGADVLGVDFSEECISIAQERCPQCKFDVLDFRQLDSRYGKFHGVFACASLIHIEQEILPDVIRRIRNVLVDNGYLAMMVQDGEGINENKSLLEVDGRKLHRTVYCYSKDNMVFHSKEVGLEFIKEGYLDKRLIEYGWRNYIFGISKKS